MFKLRKEYKISVSSDDWVAPEETLLDSSSQHSNIEKPISNSVFSFSFIAMFSLALVIVFFTAKLSILNYEYFADLSSQNSTANFFIPPPRGMILDRNGTILAKNLPSFDLLAISREIKDDKDMTVNISKLAKTLNLPEEEFKTFISDQIKQNSIFIASKDLTKEDLLEVSYISPKGFYVVPNIKRDYIDGRQFSSIIGYVGKVNKEDLKDAYYKTTDVVGRLGIESQYEKYLRGEHGKIFFKEDGRSENQDPKSGRNLVLTIDYDLQKKLYSELYEILRVANIDKASAVIQNPSTGEVLALVSFPSYDNNSFVSGISGKDFERLFQNKSRPLFNRVISGLYNPGSTIKPFLGMAILEENIFTPQDSIRDCVELVLPNPYQPDSPAVFNNWRSDFGLFNLRRAIANSCNIYFFIAGGGYKNIKGLGIERIAKYLGLSMADKKLGVDLPGEEKGFIPTPNWKLREKGEGWYQGDTYNVSIGQGDLLVTPLWINSYVSAVANGGKILKPFIVKEITDQSKNRMELFERRELTDLPFKIDNINEVRRDMEETVLSGTAQIFKDLPVRVGAKTGTSEVIKGSRTNSLFTAFVPFENPELSITILIEESTSDQGVAVRTAHNVLKWYFTKNASN